MAPPTLSRRLEAVLACIGPCECLVDIGTDHGLLPLAAAARGLATRAIGIDRASAPLAGARENLARAGLGDRVGLYRGDGLAAVPPGQGDVLAICGMGGKLAVSILSAGAGALGHFRRLVVQPNASAEAVRAWARRAGWQLVDERLVHEDARYFPVLAFVLAAGPDRAYTHEAFTPAELEWLGPHLLADASPVTRAYYAAQRDRLTPHADPLAGLWARALTQPAASEPAG